MAKQIPDISYRPNGTFIYRNSFRTLKQANAYARRLRKRTGSVTGMTKTTNGILPGARIPTEGVLYSVYIKS